MKKEILLFLMIGGSSLEIFVANLLGIGNGVFIFL